MSLTVALECMNQKICQLRENHIALACARVGQADTVRKPVEQAITDNLAAVGRDVSASSTIQAVSRCRKRGRRQLYCVSACLSINVMTGTGISILLIEMLPTCA
jgi:hypothetical protein